MQNFVSFSDLKYCHACFFPILVMGVMVGCVVGYIRKLIYFKHQRQELSSLNYWFNFCVGTLAQSCHCVLNPWVSFLIGRWVTQQSTSNTLDRLSVIHYVHSAGVLGTEQTALNRLHCWMRSRTLQVLDTVRFQCHDFLSVYRESHY